MTQNGIEMVTLQQSMSALIGAETTQKDLEQFYDFFGLDSTDKIYTQGEALAYVNEELRKRKELVSDSVAARLAVGAGAVTQAGYASSPSLMRGQASKDQAL